MNVIVVRSGGGVLEPRTARPEKILKAHYFICEETLLPRVEGSSVQILPYPRAQSIQSLLRHRRHPWRP